MLNSILIWLAEWLLNWLLGRTVAEIKSRLIDMERDHAREKVNEENVKAYEAANGRLERVQAALSLLNRATR